MKILWLTWKDRKNPSSGGAEVVNEELAKRLVNDGHTVIFLVRTYPQCQMKEQHPDGYTIIRLGGSWLVYWYAYRYYKKYLQGWADLVIDEINTIPFFAKWYVKEQNIIYIYQLAREIWFHEMFFPFNVLGYLLEPLYLRLLRDRLVITESQSTKEDLLQLGFEGRNIFIVPIGLTMKPATQLPQKTLHNEVHFLYFGSLRAMKRPDHVMKAFHILMQRERDEHHHIPPWHLWIAGTGEATYLVSLLCEIQESPFQDHIHAIIGKTSEEKKIELMQKAHILFVTSVREGWGIVVTEANSQGTPAIVYNIHGLRDAVQNGKTGWVCTENTPQGLAMTTYSVLQQKEQYDTIRKDAWDWSKELTYDRSYVDFLDVVHPLYLQRIGKRI